MAKIIGNTTATPNPRPDWLQSEESKADYIKNKPKLIKYKTELLKAGNSQVKVELPIDAVIVGVEVRDASGALVMVDSVVTKGSLEDIDDTRIETEGIYQIKPTSEFLNAGYDASEIGYVELSYDVIYDGQDGSSQIIEDLRYDTNGSIIVNLSTEKQDYPDFGEIEGDHQYTYRVLMIMVSEYVEKVIKITYPSVSISISEPINEDLEIIIIYQE